MLVGNFCTRDVVVVSRETGVLEAAHLMREQHVGNVIVVEVRDGSRVPVGIVTDRDLVMQVMARDVSAEALSMQDVMSPTLETVSEKDQVLETLEKMRKHGIRRMPVVDSKGALAGILTLDDILSLLASSLHDMAALIGREIRVESRLRT